MTKEELATKLEGNERCDEIFPDEAKLAKENRLVVVYGASDDLIELAGAIDEEISAYDGGSFLVTKHGLHINTCDNMECPNFDRNPPEAKKIEAVWGKGLYQWKYITDIPHATFDIYDDGKKYCRGIVFSLDDLG